MSDGGALLQMRRTIYAKECRRRSCGEGFDEANIPVTTI
jgi:hypothetical protein